MGDKKGKFAQTWIDCIEYFRTGGHELKSINYSSNLEFLG
jgi:hypothetical protein